VEGVAPSATGGGMAESMRWIAPCGRRATRKQGAVRPQSPGGGLQPIDSVQSRSRQGAVEAEPPGVGVFA